MSKDKKGIERTMEREFWHGLPVIAYHWTIHDPECPIEGLRERHGIAYHWSTGPSDAKRLISTYDAAKLLTRDTPTQEQGWRAPGAVPEITPGSNKFFIVAVRRDHNGKVYTFPAQYLHDVTLWFEDDGEERRVTGWFDEKAEGDEASAYNPLLNPRDELMGWKAIEPFPFPSEALS